MTGETIKGVFFELTRELDQLPEEGLSDPQGSYEFAIINAGTYTIQTRKAGYLSTKKVLQVRPEMLMMNENFLNINLPLVKNLEQFDKRTKIAIISSNYRLEGISLEVLQQENSRTKTTIHKDEYYQTALLTMNRGHQSITLSEESLAQLD